MFCRKASKRYRWTSHHWTAFAVAERVARRLDGAAINALVLNVSTQATNLEKRTQDDFVLTFGANHLAHCLLARLLNRHLAEHGRLILTTSDTPDPAMTPMAPNSLGPQALAHGQGPVWRRDARLCGVFFQRPCGTDWRCRYRVTVDGAVAAIVRFH